MSERFAVSPFGGRGLARAQFTLSEQVIRARREQAARADSIRTNGAEKADGHDKWKLIRAVTEARTELKLSDRTIVVLEALVSFCPERTLSLARPVIVFPSNTELSLRTRGMAPATLRRHVAALVEAGLILRRDSANGKRYACRDEKGRIEAAFGFDLCPLAARAPEIERLAAEVRRRTAEIRALRSEITIHLRDIAALLRAAREEGREPAVTALEERLEALSGRLGRNTDLETLRTRRDRLVVLRAEVERAWLASAGSEVEPAAASAAPAPLEEVVETEKMSANDAQNERHIESSDSEDSYKGKKGFSESADRADGVLPTKVDSCQRSRPTASPAEHPVRNVRDVALSSVLSACPQIRDYAPGGIHNWRDLAKAADLVRTMLGVSAELWLQARSAMGEINAAITVTAMLERAEELKSPGAYLRSLAKRAEADGFSARPMLHALLSAKLRERGAESAYEQTAPRGELLKTQDPGERNVTAL